MKIYPTAGGRAAGNLSAALAPTPQGEGSRETGLLVTEPALCCGPVGSHGGPEALIDDLAGDRVPYDINPPGSLHSDVGERPKGWGLQDHGVSSDTPAVPPGQPSTGFPFAHPPQVGVS